MTEPEAANMPEPVTTSKLPRRGDLDALRGFAMLLGLVLHASLAYFPFPWPVQDLSQSRPLGFLYALIHGFRMPLFFLLSGFFTALIRRRHGLRGLLEQRTLRILLPLVLGTASIVPLDRAVIAWAMRNDPVDIDVGHIRDQVLRRVRDDGPGPLDTVALQYHAALASPRLAITCAGHSWQVFESNVFDHLWFLWYLCWLVALFALAEAAGLGPTGRHRWWLVPASCLPFALMWSPFGADTALGLLPSPHLILFYGCFYWFGAATGTEEGTDTTLGRHWAVLLPVVLFVIFPAGVATIGVRAAAAVLQPFYAWGMSIGLIGLFHRFCTRPIAGIRWLSDASYWMYLVHLPLVIACQAVLRDRPWPAGFKFVIVLAVTVAGTLVTYRWCVRYTRIGWLLNGPRFPSA